MAVNYEVCEVLIHIEHPSVAVWGRISIGNSMVSSAIWRKTCTSEFFKDSQNCTSPNDECNLKFLKNSQVFVLLGNND